MQWLVGLQCMHGQPSLKQVSLQPLTRSVGFSFGEAIALQLD